MAFSSLGGVTSPLQNVDLRAERFSVVVGQMLLVSTVLVLPLLYTLIPPLEDYPNHLARMFAIAKLRESPALLGFYEVNWALIPNLIMDLLTPPLVPLVGVYAAGRLFLGAALLVMLTGPMVLHRALHGSWSAWPLVGGVFV